MKPPGGISVSEERQVTRGDPKILYHIGYSFRNYWTLYIIPGSFWNHELVTHHNTFIPVMKICQHYIVQIIADRVLEKLIFLLEGDINGDLTIWTMVFIWSIWAVFYPITFEQYWHAFTTTSAREFRGLYTSSGISWNEEKSCSSKVHDRKLKNGMKRILAPTQSKATWKQNHNEMKRSLISL